MATDAYTLCPGGYPKRIKFCCKDLLADLQQLDRMIQGEQNLAALERVETLLEQKPDRACLMEIKAQLLESLERDEEWAHLADDFAVKHPTSPIAHAERALILASDENADVKQAVAALQDALERTEEGIQHRVYEAMGLVAHALVADGHPVAARALWSAQAAVFPEERHPLELALQVTSSPRLPLLVKDDRPFNRPPADSPHREAFEKAMEPIRKLRWRQAGQRMMELAQQAPDEPAVWSNLATLLLFLAENESAQEALRQYAALDVPEDDAVEAEALAMFLEADPLGDSLDLVRLTWELADPDEVQRRLFSPRLLVGRPEAVSTQLGISVKGVWGVLDRPSLAEGQEPSLDSVPRAVGSLVLLGRQTDAPAKLQFTGSASQEGVARSLLAELLGDSLSGQPERIVAGRTSGTHECLNPDWHLPEERDPAKHRATFERLQREAIRTQWPDRPLGALGGQTPRQAAEDPNQRIRLQAVILVVEALAGLDTASIEILRQTLGLPAPTPISPAGLDVAELPAVRLAHLDVPALSDEQLRMAFSKAGTYAAGQAVDRLAREIIRRPAFDKTNLAAAAYRFLAGASGSREEALEYVERGRKAGGDCAQWDFFEINLHLRFQQPDELRRVMMHLEQQHRREPGVMENLMRLLVNLGLIHPDGTPVEPPQTAAEAPAIVVPGGEAEPGKLWMPDEPAGGTGGKIWLPE